MKKLLLLFFISLILVFGFSQADFGKMSEGAKHFCYSTSGEGETLYTVGGQEVKKSQKANADTFAEADFVFEKTSLIKIFATYYAVPLKKERIDDKTVYYCFSPKLGYAVSDGGLLINLQIIVTSDGYIAATPTFVESF